MLDTLRAHPIATPLAGAVFAGAVAMTASFGGVPDPYSLVLGLAVAIPVLNLTSSGERFDMEGYEDERGTSGMVFDAVLSAVAGVLIGASSRRWRCARAWRGSS